MSKGYAIYLAKNNKSLKVVEFPIPQYARMQQLVQFLNEHTGSTVTCADLIAAGFKEITEDLMAPTQPMGKSGRGKLADDAKIKLDDKGIQEIYNRIVAYNNCKAAERINMNRLIRIDYNGLFYKSSIESIDKCIQHFYNLAGKLKSAFSNVSGISFGIGEEEVQYANLYFRVLYKGRVFIQLLGKFGGATFIHIINSKYLFPQWEITVTPYEETSQLHGTFKEVHIQNATDNDVLQKVTATYNARVGQYAEVKSLFAELFKVEISDSEFEFDLVRECIMLQEETERKIIGELLPKPVSQDIKEFYKYTSLETFMKIFQKGNIRMNSVVAMNDTSETNILQDVIRNFKEPVESEADAYLESNTHFITSFSALKDALPMWSQYGNKGTGVCLVFERGPFFKEGDLLQIKYINKTEPIVKIIEKLQAALKEKSIKFYFALLDKYRNFIKFDFYDSEEEYRYLVVNNNDAEWTINTEYNLVAPYIDRPLNIGNERQKKMQKNSFPFVLKRVILGPAMVNQKYNEWQLNYMASRKKIWEFKADASKIDNFR